MSTKKIQLIGDLITIDNELNIESGNPIANKVVTEQITNTKEYVDNAVATKADATHTHTEFDTMLTDSDLSSAITTALSQAKESGEFDGADGTSCTHSWNGTTLSVTSASGTSSADLKGEKGDKGDTGVDGYTPVKGTDYFTEADKTEIAQKAAELMPQPDLSQNDETQADYIKNRTHWAEGGTKTLFDKIVFGYDAEEGLLFGNGASLEPIEGATYTFAIDGIGTFVSQGRTFTAEGTTATVIGNIGYIMPEVAPDTGENFVVICGQAFVDEQQVIAIMFFEDIGLVDGEVYTVTITELSETVHKLDNKYLDLAWIPKKELKKSKWLDETVVTHQTQFTGDTSNLANYVSADVIFDGVTYNTKVVTIQLTEQVTVYEFGNLGAMSPKNFPNTGEPFYIVIMGGNGKTTVYMSDASDTSEHTIAIYMFTEVVNRMPQEFLPESVFATESYTIPTPLNEGLVYEELSSAYEIYKNEGKVYAYLDETHLTPAELLWMYFDSLDDLYHRFLFLHEGVLFFVEKKWISGSDEATSVIEVLSTLHLDESNIDKTKRYAIPAPTTSATVGQILRVSKVDSEGHILATEPVDQWTIQSSTEGSTNQFTISVDDDNVITIGDKTVATSDDISEIVTEDERTLWNSAVQSVSSGSANGTVSVDGADVAVTGLGEVAYMSTNDVVNAVIAALPSAEEGTF